MRPLEIGLVLPLLEDPRSGKTPSWDDVRTRAVRAEQIGADTVWLPDELLWKIDSWPGPRGFWECVAMTGAVAAATSTIKVGTWVLSALHRNPGLTAKVAATLDEISSGRFVFGLGAGHAGTQGEMFGYPSDATVGRYAEAVEIVVSLLRSGESTLAGTYHRTADQQLRPSGPRSGNIPLMLAGHGPRTIGIAVEHGDIWSAFATTSSHPDAFAELMQLVDRTCEERERDPVTLGRSVGVFVEPGEPSVAASIGFPTPLSGGVAEIAEKVHLFAEMGFTGLELVPVPDEDPTYELIADVLDALDS